MKDMSYRKHRFVVKVITLWIISIVSGCHISTGDKNQRVRELESIFPILAKCKVQAYRNQDWCKNISYKRGRFSNNNKQSTCNLFEGKAKEFNDQAKADFNAIENTLKSTNLSILYFDIEYDKNNNIKSAVFNISCLGCARDRFVYSFNYGRLPENEGQEIQYSAVNSNWYYVTEDWN